MPPQEWRSWFSWRFGKPGTRPLRAASLPGNVAWTAICERCLPLERVAAKEEAYVFAEESDDE